MAEEMVTSLEMRTRLLASRMGSLESSFFVCQRAGATADVILEQLTFKQEEMEAAIKQLETDFQDIRECKEDAKGATSKESEGRGEGTKFHQDCRRQVPSIESA